MEYTKEQMEIIHDVCLKEIRLLKTNLDKLIRDSEQCQKMLNALISEQGSTNVFGLIIFDLYMSQMMSALNMARKYNIHLEINNLDQSVINASSSGCLDGKILDQTRLLKDFIEWRKYLIVNDMGYGGEINGFAGRIQMSEQTNKRNEANILANRNITMKSLEPNRNNATKKEEDFYVSNNIDNMLTNVLPVKDLKDFKSGYEFQSYIVFVRDCIKLEFFIVLKDDYKTLYDLSSTTTFNPISHDLLPLNDVFCVLDNKESTTRECIWRAVIVPGERYDSKKFIYLLDFGDIIPLTDNCKTFAAPLRYRGIPPLAIKCILEGIEDSSSKLIKDQDACKLALQKNEFEKVNFRLLHQKGRVFHVLMLESPTSNENSNENERKNSNPFLNFQTIFEKDDEYSSANSDVLQLPRSIIYDSSPTKEPVLTIGRHVGHKIQVLVTHVIGPISFYGIIQKDNCTDVKILSWHDRQIFSSQKQMPAPQLNDIVLAQYAKDGYWYRAKVVNIDLKTDFYEVFYVDFGNTEVIHSSGMAKCSKEQLENPPYAIRFHLYNLSIVSDEQNVQTTEKTRLKIAVENMVVMILDQTINVEIMERRNDDLVVRLIDSQYADIPKTLVGTGVVREISKQSS